MRRMHGKISDDGKQIRFLGIDFGDQGARKCQVWKRDRFHLVFKTPGGKYWSAIGLQAYGPVRFHVCRILEANGNEVTLEPVTDFVASRPE